jgi:hypothetical protein
LINLPKKLTTWKNLFRGGNCLELSTHQLNEESLILQPPWDQDYGKQLHIPLTMFAMNSQNHDYWRERERERERERDQRIEFVTLNF